MDINIRLGNGQVLRGLILSPGDRLRAVVIMVHGLGEHIFRYEAWAKKFNMIDIGFAGVDLPGHGRSDGKRGHIKSYRDLYEMLDILISEAGKTFNGLPVFIYGHSLGGNVVLSYLLKQSPRIRGAIVTSPWLRLAFQPSEAKIKAAAFMKHFLPAMVQASGLVTEHLCHDTEVVEKYRKDKLVHDKISLKLFSEAVKSAGYILSHSEELKIPLLIMHGDSDMITSSEATAGFARKAPHTQLKIWEGGYHELHNEPFRDQVFSEISGWIEKRLSAR
ncbi:MAG: alpha/beta hydrolase [Bacteroidales bacterium]|nr:alpha/beta hydrolase [Bacteroidales bacterium]